MHNAPDGVSEKNLAKGLAIAMPIGALFGFGLMLAGASVVFIPVGIGMGLSVGIAIGFGLDQRDQEK